jgi:hypothetical protein
MGFFNIYLFSRHLNFPWSKYIMLLTTIGLEWGGGGDIHSMTIFSELFNIVHDLLNKNFKIILVPSSYFPLLSQFQYPSLLNDIQVWDIKTWKKLTMDINNFDFIYLLIMDEFHLWFGLFNHNDPIIYLFNPNHKWNSSMQKWHSSIWNHSFLDIFIHVGGLNHIKL